MRTPERCACALWLSVASSTPFCARDAHKCIMLLCIGAFRIIFLHNERLLIAFLVCLIWHMVLPHYCAVRLKEMYLNYTAYIFLCKYIACFPWMYFTTIQRAIYNFVPDLVLHLFTFLYSPIIIFSQILDFIKLCTHDFSRVKFSTELSNKLVYKSNFFIDYIYIHLLFFFTVKLSIFSRLCVKHKSDEQVNTHQDIEILHWFKQTVLVSDWYRQILKIFGICIIGSEKVVSSHP